MKYFISRLFLFISLMATAFISSCALFSQERRIDDVTMRTYEWETQLDKGGIGSATEGFDISDGSGGACPT